MKLPADPRARAAVFVVGFLVAFAVVIRVIDFLIPEPHGPASSSYATSPRGLAAYASLLGRSGHPVRRLRTAVAGERPSTRDTLVVLDPQGARARRGAGDRRLGALRRPPGGG